ncbi:ROK family protein [Allorhizobium sp. BGMRC 0089]|uniref:ROK family protein n=1 Tax=Allorhizobium sonneratiae TaxID=2934936 RepID=UPI002034563D|nr:ROK family protein [Allorhizobium sonneratiae]MCM2293220.1 ROK family protein [Allorhizobium sonneratiae]
MIVCFDIGGTAIKGALAFSPDDIRPFPRIATPSADFSAFVDALKSVIEQAPERPTCVAISICGVIDPEDQRANVANIPCIHTRLLQQDLEAALDLPVIIANDADCFVMAEAARGAGRGHRVVFGIILGTGVGGGIVVNGSLINQQGGFAGEWGHGAVAATEAGEPPLHIPRFACGCGQKGCIDATCSARGMEKIHAHLTGKTRTSEQIVADWLSDDPEARRTIEIYIDLLSAPLAMAINLTGASIVPVGGGLSNAIELINAIDLAVRARILHRYNRPVIVTAQLHTEPGLIGAAMLGLAYQPE